MISNNYIPEKINEYNAYLDGTKMIGVAASVTLPEVNMKTSTVSGVGVRQRPVQSMHLELPVRKKEREKSEKHWG